METKPSAPATAYPETHAAMAHSLKDASFNAAAFERPLKPCDIDSCRGMCCYDGVYVNAEEERVLQGLAKDAKVFFESVGAPVSTDPVVDAEWRGVTEGRKTAVAPRDFRETMESFPAHFDSTACVFLTPEGRCSLQLLAEHERKDPWFYKPLACTMHPIRLSLENKEIDLPNKETEPYVLPDYPGYTTATQCGACTSVGKPAHEVLKPELEYLSRIIGRDLVGELGHTK